MTIAKILLPTALLTGLIVAGMALSAASTVRAEGMCKEDWTPVCGTVNGMKRTFSNACWAKKSGAKMVSKGACKW